MSLPPIHGKKARKNPPKRGANTAKNKCECGLSWCAADLDNGKITISYKEANAGRKRAFDLALTRLGVDPTTRSSVDKKRAIRLGRCVSSFPSNSICNVIIYQ